MTISGTGRGARLKVVATVVAVVAVAVGAALVAPAVADRVDHVRGGRVLANSLDAWSELILYWPFWVFVLGLGFAELRWPARPGEGLFTVGAAQDLAWFLLTPLLAIPLVKLTGRAMGHLEDALFGSASLDLRSASAKVVAIGLGFLLADFFMWCSHYLRHRSATLWRFHQVHHSQTQMSPLTDRRFHFVEPLVFVVIATIPAGLLGLSWNEGRLLFFATVFATTFTHANLRWNMGPLRHVLVTPQSHRIHHSNDRRHWERNYGAVLSIWDRLFRTRWADADEYPVVGTDDPDFPLERSAGVGPVLRTYGAQLVYPARRVVADHRPV